MLKFQAYKTLGDPSWRKRIKIDISEALTKVREFNKEFCNGRSDEELIFEMKCGYIYTNLSAYWNELISEESANSFPNGVHPFFHSAKE